MLPRRRVKMVCSSAESTNGVVFDVVTRQPKDAAGVDVGDDGCYVEYELGEPSRHSGHSTAN